jgi:hypothetical protein
MFRKSMLAAAGLLAALFVAHGPAEAAGPTGAAGVEPALAAVGDELVQKVYGRHRQCEWSPEHGNHRHVGANDRVVSCSERSAGYRHRDVRRHYRPDGYGYGYGGYGYGGYDYVYPSYEVPVCREVWHCEQRGLFGMTTVCSWNTLCD